MSEIMASVLIMVSELAFVLAIAFGFSMYKTISRQRRDHEQAKLFVEKLREKEPERNSARIDLLKAQYQLDDDAIQTYIERLTATEKSLYGKIIKIFLGKEKEVLGGLDEDIEALVKNCYVPVGNTHNPSSNEEDGVEIEVDSQQVADLTKGNTQLKEENERLIIELEEMKKQSTEMMAEYTMMYGKQGEVERQKVELVRDEVKKEKMINQIQQKKKRKVTQSKTLIRQALSTPT